MDVGFVYLQSPGLSAAQQDTMFNRSKQLFDLPISSKMQMKKPNIEVNRGYSPVGAEKLTNLDKEFGADSFSLDQLNENMPDMKEMFEIGSDASHHQFQNIWPCSKEMPGFKEEWMSLYWSLQAINVQLMQTVSLGLGLHMNQLDYLVNKGDNNFRALNYPKVQKNELDVGIRGGAHTDYGTFTLLFQDDSGGLQVMNHETQQF